MMSLTMLIPTLAAVSCLALGTLALVGRPRLGVQWLFGLGMLGFTVESLLSLLVLTAKSANGQMLWLPAIEVVSLLLLLPWGFFVVTLAQLQRPTLPRAWHLGLGLSIALALTSAAAVLIWPAFTPGPGGWTTTGAILLPPARAAAIVQLLLTVGILTGLEACLRTSRGDNRRRVKYLVIGLGGIFLVRFYVLSQILLFHAVAPVYLKTMCATLFLGNLLLTLPIARDQLRGAEITVSRQMLYRSATIGVLGFYLFVVAILGSLLTYLAIPEETFWGSVVVFISALILSAVLLSDRLRWRFQRFIARHFYGTKYDYREQWMAFTKRTSSLLTAEETGKELIEGLAQATGATAAGVYLADGATTRYRLGGQVGASRFAPMIDASTSAAAWLGGQDVPAPLPSDLLRLVAPFLPSAIAVPLRWRGSVIGFIVLGPERTGEDYGVEDLDFLSTVAEQAAGSVVTARLSESIAQAREMETFDRVTAAVIHDIKNSVSALSMLSRNAVRHFDDPEFQRDTITTLSRTVDRMRRLLAKLSSPVDDASPLRVEPVDLAELASEATRALAAEPRIRLVLDLGRVGPVAGEREPLLRVVENLVTNATEAIRGDGTLTIALGEAKDRAILTVKDTGCGIPEEFLRRHLFAPFRSTKNGGWGIGLYQTKQVVERHRGEILVDSTEGAGTTFCVKLLLWSALEQNERHIADSSLWETVR